MCLIVFSARAWRYFSEVASVLFEGPEERSGVLLGQSVDSGG